MRIGLIALWAGIALSGQAPQVVRSSSTSRIWGISNSTPVTSASAVTEQNLQAVAVPSATLNTAGLALDVSAAIKRTSGSTAAGTVTYRLKLCTVSGCATGTVITLATWLSGTLAVSSSAVTDVIKWTGWITASGASGTLEGHGSASITLGAAATGASTLYNDQIAAVSSAIDLTGALFIQVTGQTSVGSTGNASNVMTHRMLVASSH